MDANRGWIGGNPIGANDPNIRWTTDGGTTWQLATAPDIPTGGSFTIISDIAFRSDTLGWFITRSGEIWVSKDGGDNWEKETISSTGNVPQLNELGISPTRTLAVGTRSGAGIAANYSILERGSPNTNFTWIQGPPYGAVDNEETMFSAFMLNDSIGFAGGGVKGKVYKQESKDNTDWSLSFEVPAAENASNIRAISFGNDQTGWFLTGRGDLTQSIVYQTLDQGDTWTELPRLAQNGADQLLKLYGVSNETTGNHIWVVGRSGRIIKGTEIPSSVKGIRSFSYTNVFPNPVNDHVNVSIVLDKNTELSISMFNTMGQQVKMIYSGDLPPGKNTVRFDGMNNLLPGMYLLKIQSTDGRMNTLQITK